MYAANALKTASMYDKAEAGILLLSDRDDVEEAFDTSITQRVGRMDTHGTYTKLFSTKTLPRGSVIVHVFVIAGDEFIFYRRRRLFCCVVDLRVGECGDLAQASASSSFGKKGRIVKIYAYVYASRAYS